MRNRIRLVRKNAGLTQQEFSLKLGYSSASCSNWEKTNAQEPPEPVKQLICNMFNVNEHWLRTGEGEMYTETPASMLDRLAEEKNMGPGGRFLMKAILRVYEELGEDKCIELIYDLLPEIQDELETLDINRAVQQENASERSSQESAQ